MIILGVMLLILGLLLDSAVLWILGMILAVIGGVLGCLVPWTARSALAVTATSWR